MPLFNRKTVEVEVLDPVLPKQELRRRAFLTESPKSEVETLALEAERLLGYGTLRQHVKAPGPLAAVLRELQIPVFNDAEVERYKLFMERSFRKALPDDQYGYWATENLNRYSEPVPEFVLRKAIQIKRLLPKAEFQIAYLKIGFKSADPFLIVELWEKDRTSKESFTIEVWDEPEFEAKL